MIDQKKVRLMHRMAVADSGPDEKKLKIGSYTLVDFIIRELAFGIVFGTIAFGAGCGLWLCMIWDDINVVFKNADYYGFIQQVADYYIKFMIIYLIICAIAAFIRHRGAKKFKKAYLANLERVGGSDLLEQGE